ncbi:CU044_5270 family protein [Streptomyces sp. NBC_01497]|uniref:CU044_5270 family protein n=1 Tax=Streptomyces sp. NBC_01497 TaxID=2903885 RepID=UPI002E2F2821|nr:CU044_5270 family protein [Streptomyces sp. NBC_01497]
MSTYEAEESGMTERQALLDFPGTEALRAAGRTEPPSAGTMTRVLAAVEEAVREEAARSPRVKGQKTAVVRPLRRRNRVLAVLAAAAVAAGVTVTCLNTGGTAAGTRHGTQTQSASVFLDHVAEVAATRSAGSGKYWKTRTKTGELYISRSMDMTYVVPGKSFDGKPSRKGHFPGWDVGSKTLDWNGLDTLTTDPTALRRLMLSTKKGPWEEDAGTVAFEQAGLLLSESPAGPKLRAGVFKALAGLTGVTNVGTVKDADGRSGTGLAYHGGIGTTELIIDPRTSTLLELDTPWKSEKDDRTATFLPAGLTDTIS